MTWIFFQHEIHYEYRFLFTSAEGEDSLVQVQLTRLDDWPRPVITGGRGHGGIPGVVPGVGMVSPDVIIFSPFTAASDWKYKTRAALG